MRRSFLSALCLAMILAYGCGKRPTDIIKEDKMVQIMADIQIAEAYERYGHADDFLQGENRDALGRGILKHYGVTMEEMDSTLAWYGRNMDEYSKLYKKIDAELAKRQSHYAKASGEAENEQSSTDLWPYGRHLIIDDKSYSDGIIVDIPVTDLTPGDKIVWKMTAQGATSKSITLGVEYDDGTSEITRTNDRGFDQRIESSLQTDSLHTVARIFGVAKFESDKPRVFVDSLQILHLSFNPEEMMYGGFQRKVGRAGRKIILPPDTTENSSLTPEEITESPSSSTGKSLGVSTRR